MANIDKINQAIARARAAQVSAEGKSEEKEPRKVLSKEEREALQAQRQQEREAKKLERAAIQEQKKAEREAAKAAREAARAARKAEKALERAKSAEDRPVPHVGKIARVLNELPELDEETLDALETTMAGLNAQQLSLFNAHLKLRLRIDAAARSVDLEFPVGAQVRIVSSELYPHLIGQVGTVTEMRKVRVLLSVEGEEKPVYLFAADCEPLDGEQDEETATEDDEEDTEVAENETDVVGEDGFLTIDDAAEATEDEEDDEAVNA